MWDPVIRIDPPAALPENDHRRLSLMPGDELEHPLTDHGPNVLVKGFLNSIILNPRTFVFQIFSFLKKMVKTMLKMLYCKIVPTKNLLTRQLL